MKRLTDRYEERVEGVGVSAKQKLTKQDRDAEHRPCIRCGRMGETRNCHYSGLRQHKFGKGRGIKCNRLLMAEFCQNCDDRFSESNYPLWEHGSKSIERSEEFMYWILLTLIRRENGD